MGQYKSIDLDLFCPSDRDKRRKYIKELKLSVPIMIYRMSYGGNLGTLNFVWSVPIDDSPERATTNARIMSKIADNLPKYSTRAMKRDFINMYSQYVKTPKSVLRYMFHELTGTEPAHANAAQQTIDDRVANILLSSDDPELLLDYRSLNGSDADVKY